MYESGTIKEEKFAPTDPTGVPTIGPCLEVARGDFSAYLRLPTFPARALTEWLACRRCEIHLLHPVMKIDAAWATPA